VGGQFAAKSNPEADISIDDEPVRRTLVDQSTHRHRNPDGSIGGVVSNTAMVAPGATIGPDAAVLDFAVVADGAWVLEGSVVRDRAFVGGTAQIRDGSVVAQDASVGGHAIVSGSVIDEEAHVTGRAIVRNARITNDAFVGSSRIVSGEDGVFDDTAVSENVMSDGFDCVPAAWLDEDVQHPHSGIVGRSEPIKSRPRRRTAPATRRSPGRRPN
jgi:carbonic anhydrase/acetyltransferase-like protein (isoleucine patch superfamily)